MTAVAPRERKTLWTVRDAGTGPALVFVLSGYGDAWVASGLSRALGTDQTLYALQPPNEARTMTAGELAVLYARHLRAAQPAGPYCLCGYSAGAVMALEIANVLRAEGETVGLVAMLDPFFIRWDVFERAQYRWTHRVRALLERIIPRKVPLLQILASMDRDEGFKIHMRALTGHRPTRYDGEIAYYRTRVPFGKPPFLVAQVRWFTGARLRIRTVPGNHHTFIRPPHVAELARLLREDLRRVEVAAP